MRSLAINIMYYAATWDTPQPPLFAKAREAGFDAVEISLTNGGDFDITGYRQALDDAGVQPYCILGVDETTDLSSPDPAIQQAGVKYLTHALEATAQLGSSMLCGLPYVPWLYFPDTDDLQPYRDRCAESLREVAQVADANGVTICLEVINRFETFIFNTVHDARVFLAQVDHPAVKLHLDTYHMNMEEDSITDAIHEAGDLLGHFHCVASNRKLPGKGHLDWSAIRQALDDANYDGGLGIECFPQANTETGRTVNTWRPLVDDLEADIKEAAQFVRAQLID